MPAAHDLLDVPDDVLLREALARDGGDLDHAQHVARGTAAAGTACRRWSAGRPRTRRGRCCRSARF